MAKVEIIERLNSAYQKLDAELDKVNEEECRIKELEGNVSVCDIVAYQIGWGKLLLGWESAEQKGTKPAMPAPGYKWNQLGSLATSFYAEYSNLPLSQLRSEYKNVVEQILNMIYNMSEEELCTLQKRQWAGDKWPVTKWIQVNTIAPYSSARRKIRHWKKHS